MKVFVNGKLPKGKWRWSSWKEGEYTIADGVNKESDCKETGWI